MNIKYLIKSNPGNLKISDIIEQSETVMFEKWAITQTVSKDLQIAEGCIPLNSMKYIFYIYLKERMLDTWRLELL